MLNSIFFAAIAIKVATTLKQNFLDAFLVCRKSTQHLRLFTLAQTVLINFDLSDTQSASSYRTFSA